MSNSPDAAKQRLVELLGSAASYNDKGAYWSGHDAGKVEAMQRDFQARQLELASALGHGVLGSELGAAIESGAAARDGSGRYAFLAEEILGVRRPRP